MVTGQVDRQGRLGMVWFDLEGSKCTTMSLYVNDKGRYRAGKATQNVVMLVLQYWLNSLFKTAKNAIFFIPTTSNNVPLEFGVALASVVPFPI